MGWWGVGLALLVPWMAGAVWLRLLWRERAGGVWPLALGYGFLLGIFGVTLVLRGLTAIGLAPGVVVPLLMLAALAIAGGRRLWRQSRESARGAALPRLAVWQWALILLLLLWIGGRLAGLALELWWHPLLAWDAWTTWAFRARAWAELHQLVPFVSPQAWLADTSGGVRTIAAWDYPDMVSLLALWPVLAFGAWNETAANLPWLGCAVALGLGFYGQARLWGIPPLTVLLFLGMLCSLPLLDTHIALAGYADLWLATGLGLASMAFFQWARNGDRRQLGLALLLALGCLMIKREGSVWIMFLIPAALAARLPGRWMLAVLAATATAVTAGWMAGGTSWSLPGLGIVEVTPSLIQAPWIGRFALAYHDSWGAVWRHFFVYDNWHLFGYLLVLAVAWGAAAASRPGSEGWLRAQMAFVLSSLAALFLLFFMTDAHLWAEKATSINRLLLHFVPTYVFWMMTLWDRECRRLAIEASDPPRGSEPSANPA